MKALWRAIMALFTISETIERIEKKVDSIDEKINEKLQRVEDKLYEHVTDHTIHVQVHQ